MPDRPEIPGFERIRADTGSFRRPDLWQQQEIPPPPSGEGRSRLLSQLRIWPGAATGAVLGSYLRQWAPPQPGVVITVVSVIACVAAVHVVLWLVFTIVDRTRRARRLAAVSELRRAPRHRREDIYLVTAPTAKPPPETGEKT